MNLPEYMKQGYRPNGPGRISCQYCSKTISSNALARASHERSKAHQDAVDRHIKRRHDLVLGRTKKNIDR